MTYDLAQTKVMTSHNPQSMPFKNLRSFHATGFSPVVFDSCAHPTNFTMKEPENHPESKRAHPQTHPRMDYINSFWTLD
jgi:hypothetical protein